MVEAYNVASFNLLTSGTSDFELYVTNIGRPYFWEIYCQRQAALTENNIDWFGL